MKLRNKLWLGMGAAFLALFLLFEWNDHKESRANILAELREQAYILHSVLMATRRTYQQVLLESGMPLNEQTLHFLPAHTMGEISRNFRVWMRNGMTFNNVSDRPRNPANMADAIELDAMAFFRASPKTTERFVPFSAPDGSAYYHYSAPIWMESFCLKCHGDRAQAPEAVSSRYPAAYGYKLGELRAVGGKYLYRLSLDESLAWRDIEPIHDRTYTDVRASFIKQIEDGVLTPQEASLTHYHEVWTRVGQVLGKKWKYERLEHSY